MQYRMNRGVQIDGHFNQEGIMRKYLFLFMTLLLPLSIGLANGVAIVDASQAIYLRLDSSIVSVSVIGQISKTITTQYFTNTRSTAAVKYGFPLSEQASAIQLRWRLASQWYTASIAGTKQDTTLPGEGGPASPNLVSYLGNTPLYFSIPQPIPIDSTLAVELTYVEFLPYAFGNVTYVYPSDYHLIQSNAIGLQKLDFVLTSQRSIDSIRVTSGHAVTFQSDYGDSARIQIILHELAGAENYAIQYSLSLSQLGLFAYSSKLDSVSVPDSLGNGFLTFIAEPNPNSTSATISKVFTLIIDRSGSMSGTKMDQAKNAAVFIVQNLNEGDQFNLIDFDDVITSFRPTHVPYTPQTRDSALIYINALYARNSTSISDAFATAVPQFTSANDSTANIIIFLTDGQPTAGITDITQLVQYVDGLITASEQKIFLFSFGIGSDVNKQLLTLLSLNNGGFADFLENDELYSQITDFYLTIRNPVLLDSHISFTPSIVTQVFPDSLPNLYKGKQMIIAGRYSHGQPVQITLTGSAFGRSVSYSYSVQLADSSIVNYQFLTKVWAKQKIEALLVHYYALVSTSEEATSIKNQIVSYGIITTFTSFTSSGTGTEVKNNRNAANLHLTSFELLGNYPNPFNPTTTIRIKVNSNFTGLVDIRVYNILGERVRTLHLQVRGNGIYNVAWDGHDDHGALLSSGMYIYAIDLQNTILVGKMTLLK
jgi:Ca-activated chloride channel family protein